MAPIKFDKVGQLSKIGSNFKTWNERTFALLNSRRVLFYFRTQKDFKEYVVSSDPSLPAGEIGLSNSNTFVVSYIEDHTFTFEIATTDRNYFIEAPSLEVLNEWLIALACVGVRIKTCERPTTGSRGAPYPREFGMQGYLEKRGAVFTSFRRRFFRTMENAGGLPILPYYASHIDIVPKGIISLHNAEIVPSPDKSAETCDFGIKTVADRTFIIRAESEDVKNKWIDVIQTYIDGSFKKIFQVVPALPKSSVNLYELLGVKIDASKEQITSGYRSAAKKYHPDRNTAEDANEKFQLVNEAYQVLSNSLSRAEYDKTLMAKSNDAKTKAALEERIRKEEEENKAQEEKDTETQKKKTGPTKKDDEGISEDSLAALAASASSTTLFRPKSVEASPNDDVEYLDYMQDQRNKCENCKAALKAMYCLQCKMDICITCSSKLHLEPETKVHKRIDFRSKKEFLEKASVVGTKEHRAVAGKPKVEEDVVSQDVVIHGGISARRQASIDEEEKLAASRKAREEEKILINDLITLEGGLVMFKIPRSGKAKLCKFFLVKDDEEKYFVRWESKKKKATECVIYLAEVQILKGQMTELFRKKQHQKDFGNAVGRSFSVVSTKRSLDIVAQKDEDYEMWMRALTHLTGKSEENKEV